MRLAKLAQDYIRYKQALGACFKTDAMHLGAFFDLLNGRQSDITLSFVNEYLWRGSKTVAYWYRKYAVLNGFNRFLSSQGFSQLIPLPKEKPQISRPFVPYVLNSYELARFFAALPSICEKRFLPANTARLFFLLLYGTGLRVGEALGLKNETVNTEQASLTVRSAKFYKTRLVPVSPLLQRELVAYDKWKAAQKQDMQITAYFRDRRGLALVDYQVRSLFEDLRDHCRLSNPESGKRPRIHDFRHTFAVHRLTSAYRRGEDVQKLLPQLATYLGHGSLGSTQVYLTMTPEVLSLANQRFEGYAFPGGAR